MQKRGDIWDTMKASNISVTEIPEAEENKRKTQVIFKGGYHLRIFQN